MSAVWYLKGLRRAHEGALQLLDAETALGKNPQFPCPLPIPDEVLEQLEVVAVPYFSFDGEVHIGQLVVHQLIVTPVRFIFSELARQRFPIASIVPVVAYGWSDERSMCANNTSAFNFRYIAGTRELSLHARGLAIDINPRQNPCVVHGVRQPRNGYYNIDDPGTIAKDSLVVRLFRQQGADWGGKWKEPFDPQHFEFRFDKAR